ncbi:MAG: DUF3016 domain-containing protein [Aquabacterium sp.]|nr:DUF3016 domain-containing protein [Aquabacterium sp.]
MKALALTVLRPLVPMALLCAGLAQAGTVQVDFDHPERYADAGTAREAERVRQVIDQHLQALGQTKLPAGQTLKVTITDIDLAGEVHRWMGPLHDVRIMGRGVDWPVIELQYALRDGERILAQGSERVADMAYLMRSTALRVNERLPYEQRMLSAWFDRRFGTAPAH